MELEPGYYASPRWSWEILDCAMPMTFDTYSNCAHQCVYCFAYFQRGVGAAADAYLAHKVKSVDTEKVKRLFSLDPTLLQSKVYRQFAWYIKNRYVLQWGGLSDGFDWYERKFRKSLELLRFFCEINYPVSISTKGVWFLDDPEYIEVLRNAENVHFKYSIITIDADVAKRLEAGCPSPLERFDALRRLNELGIGCTTLRFRPYVIGVSDKCVDEMFARAADAGVYSVTTEFLCIEKRVTPNHLERYKRISAYAGYDVWDYYRQNSNAAGLMRLNYDVKRSHIDRMEALASKYGLEFFVSDAHHKEASSGAGCCGLPKTGVLSNYNRGQFAEAILIAKRNGRVYWSDIAPQAEGLKNIPYGEAEGFNQGNTRNRAIRRYQTMFDYMHENWNNTRLGNSPAQYFGGVLVPGDVDENGDVVYLYNQPYVDDAYRVQSVAELSVMVDRHYARRQDAGDLGHVAYPVFVVARDTDTLQVTTDLLDTTRLSYTLVVLIGEQEAYKTAFPHSDLLPVDNFDPIHIQEQVAAYGITTFWKIEGGFSEFRVNGTNANVRAVLSAVEGNPDLIPDFVTTGQCVLVEGEQSWT